MTREEIEKARKELDEEESKLIEQEKNRLNKEREQRQKEVDRAHDALVKDRKEYYDLRNKFMEDYGYASVTNKADDYNILFPFEWRF